MNRLPESFYFADPNSLESLTCGSWQDFVNCNPVLERLDIKGHVYSLVSVGDRLLVVNQDPASGSLTNTELSDGSYSDLGRALGIISGSFQEGNTGPNAQNSAYNEENFVIFPSDEARRKIRDSLRLGLGLRPITTPHALIPPKTYVDSYLSWHYPMAGRPDVLEGEEYVIHDRDPEDHYGFVLLGSAKHHQLLIDLIRRSPLSTTYLVGAIDSATAEFGFPNVRQIAADRYRDGYLQTLNDIEEFCADPKSMPDHEPILAAMIILQLQGHFPASNESHDETYNAMYNRSFKKPLKGIDRKVVKSHS